MKNRRSIGILKLLASLLGLYLFVTWVVPAINEMSLFKPIQKVIKEWDIDTSSIFYTDDISNNEDIRKYTDL